MGQEAGGEGLLQSMPHASLLVNRVLKEVRICPLLNTTAQGRQLALPALGEPVVSLSLGPHTAEEHDSQVRSMVQKV